MKKAIFLAVLLTFSNNIVYSNIPQEPISVSTEEVKEAVKALGSSEKRLSKAISALKKTYKGIDKTLDHLLNPKELLKIAIVIAPLVIWYCHSHDISPLEEVIKKILQTKGRVENEYRIQHEIGEATAYLDNVGTNKSYLVVVAAKIVNMIIDKGIPFIASLYTSKFIKKE